MKTTNKKNELEYTGPTSLKKIESRLLEIEHEKPMRIHNASENYSESIEDEIEASEIKYLDVEKTQLQLKRQFILDKRQGWKAKILFSIIPVIATAIITYLISTLD